MQDSVCDGFIGRHYIIFSMCAYLRLIICYFFILFSILQTFASIGGIYTLIQGFYTVRARELLIKKYFQAAHDMSSPSFLIQLLFGWHPQSPWGFMHFLSCGTVRKNIRQNIKSMAPFTFTFLPSSDLM